MKAAFLALSVAAAGITGCATDYVPPPPVNKPGPEYLDRQVQSHRGPGMFGDLTWSPGQGGSAKPASPAAPATATEQEEFRKWRESAGSQERQEFEDWRAWQEWKRKNPK